MYFSRILTAFALVVGVECQLRITTVYAPFPKSTPRNGLGWAMNQPIQRTQSMTTVYGTKAASIPMPTAAQAPIPELQVTGNTQGPWLAVPDLGQSRAIPGQAVEMVGNPLSIVYRAVLSGQNALRATIIAQAGPGGAGVRYSIDAANLYGYGPFSYYVFERTVPQNGDCYNLGARLDPYLHGDNPKCNMKYPKSCQVGDLSGKHGKLDPVPNSRKQFVDSYSSLISTDAPFIGGRSFAILDNTGVRLACGTFIEAEEIDFQDLS